MAVALPLQGLVALAEVMARVGGVVNCPTPSPGVVVPLASMPTTVTLYLVPGSSPGMFTVLLLLVITITVQFTVQPASTTVKLYCTQGQPRAAPQGQHAQDVAGRARRAAAGRPGAPM